ncbi:MAG: S8 family serine peptidase [Saprospiraceae bacterium]|nr:S8 family serine peptidase [Saprospiraceae bacterium]
MATQRKGKNTKSTSDIEAVQMSNNPDDLLLAALERGDVNLTTGRHLITYREEVMESSMKTLGKEGFKIADTRDFDKQEVEMESLTTADGLFFAEIGVALVTSPSLHEHNLRLEALDEESYIEAYEPEYFVFANNHEYLRGFASAANTIARDLGLAEEIDEDEDLEIEALGATWGLNRCKVPPGTRSGAKIKVAVLDTGMDLGHPDFAGRSKTSKSFVGQPVQDLNGHGTHCIGTACGTRTPAGTTPRYGIAYGSRIFIGKVLSNSGSGSTSGVLQGINWAIANRCEVISMSLGSQSPVQTAYTRAGDAALKKNCLIIAAAGNAGSNTGAPANSPTIMSVAWLNQNLKPSNFSNFGKIEIAAPGGDVFSSWPRPRRYHTISGTSMATPHVAGCAALWAQTNVSLRGKALWKQLQNSARKLPFPASKVGAGLVQAPK